MEESTKEVTVDAREMLSDATGPLEYGLTNDYLFKAFLQKKSEGASGIGCIVATYGGG